MGVKQPDTAPDAAGHAIVCDGYDSSSKKFHLNMGWGDTDDGWYAFPAGIPDQFTVVDDLIEKVYTSSETPERPEKPQNPNPENGDTKVYNNAYLTWDSCKNTKSYNCYLWKASENKPATPTFSNLPYAGEAKIQFLILSSGILCAQEYDVNTYRARYKEYIKSLNRGSGYSQFLDSGTLAWSALLPHTASLLRRQ